MPTMFSVAAIAVSGSPVFSKDCRGVRAVRLFVTNRGPETLPADAAVVMAPESGAPFATIDGTVIASLGVSGSKVLRVDGPVAVLGITATATDATVDVDIEDGISD